MENMTRDSKPYKSGLYEDFFDAASTQMLSAEEAVAYSDSYYKELENQSAVRLAERKAMERGMEKGLKKGIEKGLKKGMKEGLEKGIKEGLEKGMKEGIEKGIEKGMEKGREEAMIDIARKMRMSGMSPDEISSMTGLSLERLREL